MVLHDVDSKAEGCVPVLENQDYTLPVMVFFFFFNLLLQVLKSQ